jgi:transposase
VIADTIRSRIATSCSGAGSTRSLRSAERHGSGLGRTRGVVERTLAWLHRFRRLNMRYERRACVHEAFLMLGCSMICWNFLKPVIYF